jgi:hypothetical protein
MAQHVVSRGECLSSIAHDYGIARWQTIYNDPANEAFRDLRPDPNVIMIGDIVQIPESEPARLTLATGQVHTIKIQCDVTLLRVRVIDDSGNSFDGAEFECVVDGDEQRGVVKNSFVELQVPRNAERAELYVWATADEAEYWELELGDLDPVTEVSGQQARLNNLGFISGEVDNLMGPITRRAIRKFQGAYDLDVDGICGPITRGELIDNHGS